MYIFFLPTETVIVAHPVLDFLKRSLNLYFFYVDLITNVTYGSTVTFLWSTN
jgi:hypothetical protein